MSSTPGAESKQIRPESLTVRPSYSWFHCLHVAPGSTPLVLLSLPPRYRIISWGSAATSQPFPSTPPTPLTVRPLSSLDQVRLGAEIWLTAAAPRSRRWGAKGGEEGRPPICSLILLTLLRRQVQNTSKRNINCSIVHAKKPGPAGKVVCPICNVRSLRHARSFVPEVKLQ